MRLSVDVCSSSPTAAASLLALLFWQLADDNRWRALITSSQREMNSYPASSRGIFTVGRDRREKDRKAAENVPLLYFLFLFSFFFKVELTLPHYPPTGCHIAALTHTLTKKKKPRRGP